MCLTAGAARRFLELELAFSIASSMATTAILHVGDDTCHRIPVMERAGFVVRLTHCSASALTEAFAREIAVEAITFQNDSEPLPVAVVTTARMLSDAPFVLLQNPVFDYDEKSFDLIVPNLTSPSTWLKQLQETIAEARKLRAFSQQLCRECADVRAVTRTLRDRAARNRLRPFDPDTIWNGNSDEKS